MQTRDKAALIAFRAVLALIDMVPMLVLALAGSGARTKLVAVVEKLEKLAVTQDPSKTVRVGMTKSLAKARRTLRLTHMRPISKVAAASADIEVDLTKVKTPHATVDTVDLVTAAFEMAQAVEPHAAAFIEAGLPADFLDRLKTAALAVRQAVDKQVQTRGERKGATEGLAQQVKRGRQALAILDSLVTPELEKGDAEMLAQWRDAKRVVGRLSPQSGTSIPVAQLKEPLEVKTTA